MTNSKKWRVHFLSMGHLKIWIWWLIHSDISHIFFKNLPHFDTNGFLRCLSWFMGLLPSTLCSMGCLPYRQGHVGKRGWLLTQLSALTLTVTKASNSHNAGRPLVWSTFLFLILTHRPLRKKEGFFKRPKKSTWFPSSSYWLQIHFKKNISYNTHHVG